ncbi:hypothetical protein FRB98_002841 [Tulasnella sp. 332]|nr:hypothetical protein FRB98_002841 [Tulasnella sp. 332]
MSSGSESETAAEVNNEEADSIDIQAAACLENFRERRDPQLLDAAIILLKTSLAIRSLDDLARSNTLYRIADALTDRYEISEERADLDAAILYHQGALNLRPVGHPSRILSLANYASLLLTSYKHTGNSNHLNAAIGLHRETLNLCPQGNSSRWLALNNLGLAVKNRFQALGDREDLEEACAFHREALELTPSGHPSRHIALNSLANALQTRYDHFGDRADLDAAISCHLENLDLRAVGNRFRPRTLTNLGIVLQVLYERSGNTADLAAGIAYLRDALSLTSDGPSARALILTELANGLDLRFQQLGEQVDQDESLVRYEDALRLRPVGNSERPKTLSNMARVLLLRFQSRHTRTDLDRGIAYLREAINYSPVGYPFHSSNLHILANGYMLRFELLKNREDIDEAVSLFQSVIDGPPVTQLSFELALQDFAAALRSRHEIYSDEADLEAAVSHLTTSYVMATGRSPYHASFATHLAMALKQRIVGSSSGLSEAEMDRNYAKQAPQSQNLPDALKVIELFKEAALSDNAPVIQRLRAANRWVKAAAPLEHSSMGDAYTTALQLLSTYVMVTQAITSQHDRLSSDPVLKGVAVLTTDAAAYAIDHNDGKKTLEVLEQGRLIIMNKLIKFGTPVDDLRDVDENLANDFTRLSTKMASAAQSVGPNNGLSDVLAGDDKIAKYASTSAQWNTAVDRIRQVPGFSNFLEPTPSTILRNAAADGPIIIVNISNHHSDAIIMPQDPTAQMLIIPLPRATPETIEFLALILRQIVRDQPRDITVKIANVLRDLWELVARNVAVALERDFKLPRLSRVWWCLTSVAWGLPFHAAGPYKPGEKGFADRYVSSYTPTITSLLRIRENHNGRGPATSPPHILVVGMSKTPGEADLPFVSQEVAEVKKAGRSVTVLEGEKATRENVLERLHDHCWAHFACHGHHDEEHAFDSHFSLTGGKLSLLDIIRSGLPNAELAFLSACHSAAGDPRTPDETMHLAAGMLFAGFGGVVGTLWAMADDDGPIVAQEFYKYMFRNGEQTDYRDAAQALAAATTALRRRKVPLERWINFVHYGA